MSTSEESWPLAITLNFSALQTFETFYILGQGLVTVHQDYYIALQMTNREILPLYMWSHREDNGPAGLALGIFI